jgi:hypothetical protein
MRNFGVHLAVIATLGYLSLESEQSSLVPIMATAAQRDLQGPRAATTRNLIAETWQ